MFQGLRDNGTIFILDKTNIVPKLSVGIIEKMSDVYSRYGTPTMPMMSQPMDGVIDFTLRIGNDTAELKKIPANQSVCSPEGQPNIVVSDNREAILAEVSNIKRQRQEVVDAYEPSVKALAACEEMELILNPQLAKEQQRDEEITNLKDKIGGIEDSIGRIDEKIDAFLRALNSGSASKNKRNNESD